MECLALLSSQLFVLDFFRNDIGGQLETQMGFLSSLLALDLFSNQISGPIPTEIALMTSLKYQDCDTNFLTGTLPTELAGMASLETMWLNNNLLSGTVPSEIGLMASLTSLYLTNNFLSGSIPPEMCSMNLENLEVDCNRVQCDCCTNDDCSSATNPPGDPLFELLLSVSPDGGVALRDETSPQYRAFTWLSSPVDNNSFLPDDRLIQRFVLATFYYSTGGDDWDSDYLWLTNANECLWHSTSSSESICDNLNRIVELDLRSNNLAGSLPQELLIISDTLGEYRALLRASRKYVKFV